MPRKSHVYILRLKDCGKEPLTLITKPVRALCVAIPTIFTLIKLPPSFV